MAIRISELTEATAVPTDSVIPVVIGGVTKKVTLANLLAPAFNITAFASTTPLVECGQSIVLAFTSAQNRTPTALTLTNNANAESKNVQATPTSFSATLAVQKNTPNQTVVATLTGGDGVGTDAANATVTWGQKSFWGVSASPVATEAFIEGLANSALDTDAARTFVQSPGGTQYICFAHPTRYGTPTFLIGGVLPGGYVSLGTTISVTNAQGYTEDYTLWRSVTAGLAANTSTTVQN